jgi:filamentous hemagglutinin family protein
MSFIHNKLYILYILLVVFLNISPVAHAQIVLDGTLGHNDALPGPDYLIGSDLGQQQGGNLFHSFQEFNIGSHERATFSGPNDINNIISRVTGGNPSNIDGILRSTIPNADMYFLNPAGVIFGEYAKLDIPGSLYISTANYLRLGDDGQFDASHPKNSLLTVAPPSAFGFLDNDIASIEVNDSVLTMPPRDILLQAIRGERDMPNNTLSLIGGNMDIRNGTLLSFGGNVHLDSVASKGEILLNPITPLDNVFSKLGIITITDSRIPKDPNINERPGNIDVTGFTGGAVHIRAGQLLLQNGYIFADTRGEKDGRGITIHVDDLILENTSRITAQAVRSTGNAGNITITATRMNLADGSQINSNTRTPGDAGDVSVVVTEKLSITGKDNLGFNNASGILSNTWGIGKGGKIKVTAAELFMDDGGEIRADSGKNPYDEKHDNTLRVLGNADNITLQVKKLTLQNGAKINVSAGRLNPQGTENSGNLTINADESVLINGGGLLTNIFNKGQGGTIELNTPVLIIQDEGTIQAGTTHDGQAGNIVLNVDTLNLIRNGFMTTETLNNGQAGNIEIIANNIVRTENSSIRSQTSGKGQGGEITLRAKQIKLDNGSSISCESQDIGKAGKILIQANTVNLTSNTHIKTSSKNAAGGNITVRTPHLLYLREGTITTDVKGGEGDGGNITIEKPVFVLLDSAKIITKAKRGSGGDITIDSLQFLSSADKDNILDASSENLDNFGKIVITAPEEDISGSLLILPATLFNVPDLKNQCAGVTRSTLNKLIVIDRNVPPTTPDDPKNHYIRRLDAPKPIK